MYLPRHASMHVTGYFPCACLYAFQCVHSLCMPVCISLSTFPMQVSCAEHTGFAGRTLRDAFGGKRGLGSPLCLVTDCDPLMPLPLYPMGRDALQGGCKLSSALGPGTTLSRRRTSRSPAWRAEAGQWQTESSSPLRRPFSFHERLEKVRCLAAQASPLEAGVRLNA